MKRSILMVGVIFSIGLLACNHQKNKETSTPTDYSTFTKKTDSMHNLISIVEIPTADFARAVKFYQIILGITIQEMEMGGVTLGVLPNDEGTVNVVLANGEDYKPTADGSLLYLNAGKDLQPTLDKIKQNGGQVIVPKTAISDQMGYFALFIDSEGNKLGLHSSN